jgi:hypothetical protein
MTDMSDKREFLVVYDYGMGGLWGIFHACSADEITSLYPELVIVDTPPPWMSSEDLLRLRDEESHDINGAPWGILNALLADRARDGGGEACTDS